MINVTDFFLDELLFKIVEFYDLNLYCTLQGEFFPILNDLIRYDSDLNYNIDLYYNNGFFDNSLVLSDNFICSNYYFEYPQGIYFPNIFENIFRPIISGHETYFFLNHVLYGISPLEIFYDRQEGFLIDHSYGDLGLPESIINKNVTYLDSFIYGFINFYNGFFNTPQVNLLELNISKYCSYYQKNEKFIPLEIFIEQYNLSLNLLKQVDSNVINLNYIGQIYFINILYVIDKLFIGYCILYPMSFEDLIVRDSIVNIGFSFFFYIFQFFLGNLFFGILISLYLTKLILFIITKIYNYIYGELERFLIPDKYYMGIYFNNRRLKRFKKFIKTLKLSYYYSLAGHEFLSKFYDFKNFAMRVISDPFELDRYIASIRSLLNINRLFHILSIKQFLIDRVQFEFKEELYITILVSGYLGRAISIIIGLPFIFFIRLIISIFIRYFSIFGFLYYYFYMVCYIISGFKGVFDKEFYFQLGKCFVKIENGVAIYLFQDTHVGFLKGLSLFTVKQFTLLDVSTYNSDTILHSNGFNKIFNNISCLNIFPLIKFKNIKFNYLNSFFGIFINFFIVMPILFLLNKISIFNKNFKCLLIFNYIIYKLKLLFVSLFLKLEINIINIYIYFILFLLFCYILKFVIILLILLILLIYFFIFLIKFFTNLITKSFLNLPNLIFISIGGLFYYFYKFIKQIFYFIIYFLINIMLRPKLLILIFIIFIFNLNIQTLHIILIYFSIILPLDFIIELLEIIHIYLQVNVINDSYVGLNIFKPSDRLLCAYINLEKFFNYILFENFILQYGHLLSVNSDNNNVFSYNFLYYLGINASEIPLLKGGITFNSEFTKKNIFFNHFKENIGSYIKIYYYCLKFDSITLYYQMNCFGGGRGGYIINLLLFIKFLIFEGLFYQLIVTGCFEMPNLFGVILIKLYFIYFIPMYLFLKSYFFMLFFTYGFFSIEYFNIGISFIILNVYSFYIFFDFVGYDFYLFIKNYINCIILICLRIIYFGYYFFFDYLNKLFLFYFYEFVNIYLFFYTELIFGYDDGFFIESYYNNDNMSYIDIDLVRTKYRYKHGGLKLHVLRKKRFILGLNNYLRGFHGGTFGGTRIGYHRTGLRKPYGGYYDTCYNGNFEDRIGRRLFSTRAKHYFQIKYFRHNIIGSNYMFFQTKLYMFIQIYLKINLNLFNSYSRVDGFELFRRHSSDLSRSGVKNYEYGVKNDRFSFIRSRLADSASFISPILDISKFCNAFLVKDTSIGLNGSIYDNFAQISLFNGSLRKQYSIYLFFKLIGFFIIFFGFKNLLYFSTVYAYHPQYTGTKFCENSKFNKDFGLDDYYNIDALDFYTNKIKNLEQIFNFTINYSNYNKENISNDAYNLNNNYRLNLSSILSQFKELQRNLRGFKKCYQDDLLNGHNKLTKIELKNMKKKLNKKLNMVFDLKEQILISLIENSHLKVINLRNLLNFEKALFFDYQELILSNNINDFFTIFNIMNDKLNLLMSRGYRRDMFLYQLSYDLNENNHFPMDIVLKQQSDILLTLTNNIGQFLYKFNQYFNIKSPNGVGYKDNATPIVYKNLNGILDHTYYFVDEPANIFEDMFFYFGVCPLWILILMLKLNYGLHEGGPNTGHKNDLGLLTQIYVMNNQQFLGSFIGDTFFLNGSIALSQDAAITSTIYHEEGGVMYSYFDGGYIDPLAQYKRAYLYNVPILFPNGPIIVSPFAVDTIRGFEFGYYFFDVFKQFFVYVGILVKNQLFLIFDFMFVLSYSSNCSFILCIYKGIKLFLFLILMLYSLVNNYNGIIKIFNVDLKLSVYNIDITIKLLEYIDKYSFLGMVRGEKYFKRK